MPSGDAPPAVVQQLSQLVTCRLVVVVQIDVVVLVCVDGVVVQLLAAHVAPVGGVQREVVGHPLRVSANKQPLYCVFLQISTKFARLSWQLYRF